MAKDLKYMMDAKVSAVKVSKTKNTLVWSEAQLSLLKDY